MLPEHLILDLVFFGLSLRPIPKKTSVLCLNDYRPVALKPIMMKCFMKHKGPAALHLHSLQIHLSTEPLKLVK